MGVADVSANMKAGNRTMSGRFHILTERHYGDRVVHQGSAFRKLQLCLWLSRQIQCLADSWQLPLGGRLRDRGRYFGSVRLDGLRAALITSWPGAIHEGNGTMQVIIDERADERQRDALLKILTGAETDDMATIWWVFSAMCPNKLEPLFLPIEIDIDVEARRGHIRVPGIIETVGEPIRNPVTGAEHRARIEMPDGVEFRIAEAGSGTTRATGQIPLPNLENTHAQLAHIHFSNKGVVD